MPKKEQGPITFHLGDGNFCQVWEKSKKECVFGIPAVSDSDYCTILYQDGQPSLMRPGKFYPFSYSPDKKGTRFKNRNIDHARIVAISCSYVLNVPWGTSEGLWVVDKDGQRRRFGAHGILYVKLAGGTGAMDQSWFYRTVLSQGNANSFTVESFRDRMSAAFSGLIAKEIQYVLEAMKYDLKGIQGLTPDELLDISAKAFKQLAPRFKSEFGLTLVNMSENSIVTGFINPGQNRTDLGSQPQVTVPRLV